MTVDLPSELTILPRWFLCNSDKTPTIAHWLDLSSLVPYDELTVPPDKLAAFVFLEGDPYLFVDFDKTSTLTEGSALHSFHLSCLKNSGTYAEYSTSGTGFHLIYKTGEEWAENKKNRTSRLNLECYSKDRYGILTGLRANNNPIIEGKEEVETLVSAADDRADTSTLYMEAVADKTDDQIIALCYQNDNDGLLKRLDQIMAEGVPAVFDTSSAELQLVNRLAAYSGCPQQIERIWLRHAVSHRAWLPHDSPNKNKTHGVATYRERTITQALNNPKSYANLLKFRQMAMAGLPLPDISPPEPPVIPAQERAFAMPDGIMSTIYEYYHSAALHCFEAAAVFCSLAYMSRYINGTYEMPAAWRYGSTYSPLGSFLLLTAGTSRGKSFPMDIISRLDAITSAIEVELPEATRFSKLEDEERNLPYPFSRIAPLFTLRGKPPSGMGMRSSIAEGQGRAVFNIGEFEPFWCELMDSRNSVMEDVKSNLLTGFDGTAKGKVNYSDAEKNLDTITNVYMSLYGEATPNLYKHFDVGDVLSGLLNRFIIFDYDGSIPPPNYSGGDQLLLDQFTRQIMPLLTCVTDVALTGHKIAVGIEPAAVALFENAYSEAIQKMNVKDDEIAAAIKARDFRKAQRLAVYAAVSRAPMQPTVTEGDLEWALATTDRLSDKLVKRFSEGSVGSEALHGRAGYLVRMLAVHFKKKSRVKRTEKIKAHGIIMRTDIMRYAKQTTAFQSNRYSDIGDQVDKAIDQLIGRGILHLAIGVTTVAPGLAIRGKHYIVDGELLSQEK